MAADYLEGYLDEALNEARQRRVGAQEKSASEAATPNPEDVFLADAMRKVAALIREPSRPTDEDVVNFLRRLRRGE